MKYERITLGGLCEFKYGNSLPERKRNPGSIRVYGSNGIVGYHSQSITQGETIIIGRKGSIGEVHYSDSPCFPIDTTYYITETKRDCHLKWLYYMLRSLQLSDLNKSSAIPGLNRNDAYEKKILFPPIHIQKQIAAILEKADAAREKRRQANQLTEQFFQSAFLEMFGDPVTNPRGWDIIPLRSVVKFQGGFAFKSSDYISTGVKLVKITNVHKDVLVWDDLEFLPKEYLKKYETFALSPGDIVMSMTRPIIKSLNSVKVVKIQRSDTPCLLNQRVGRFLPDKTKIHLDYLLHFCYSEYFKNKVDSYCSTSLQPNISANQIEEIQLPLPNICEQQKFADLVEKIELLRIKQKESERELEYLFQSLMQRAFKGELVS